jgi:hypothetical protein
MSDDRLEHFSQKMYIPLGMNKDIDKNNIKIEIYVAVVYITKH